MKHPNVRTLGLAAALAMILSGTHQTKAQISAAGSEILPTQNNKLPQLAANEIPSDPYEGEPHKDIILDEEEISKYLLRYENDLYKSGLEKFTPAEIKELKAYEAKNAERKHGTSLDSQRKGSAPPLIARLIGTF